VCIIGIDNECDVGGGVDGIAVDEGDWEFAVWLALNFGTYGALFLGGSLRSFSVGGEALENIWNPGTEVDGVTGEEGANDLVNCDNVGGVEERNGLDDCGDMLAGLKVETVGVGG